MVIERTDEGVLIKTTAPLNMKVVQRFIDYCKVIEINSRAQGTGEQATDLAREANLKWWADNKHRF